MKTTPRFGWYDGIERGTGLLRAGVAVMIVAAGTGWPAGRAAAAPPSGEPPAVEANDPAADADGRPPPADPPRRDETLLNDFPIYRLLLKSGSVGAGATEVEQWERARGKLTDPQREADLTELLRRYPASDYADDAALLLARARFLYHGDADGAINGLYDVIRRYPNGRWTAEDPLLLENGVIGNVDKDLDGKLVAHWGGWYGDIGARKQGGSGWEGVTYLEYLDAKPNWTADEARYWIAWIIRTAGLEKRYPEAERNLKEIVDGRRAEQRTAADLAKASGLNGARIGTDLERTERKASRLLIQSYAQDGRRADAAKAADDYRQLYRGHPTVEGVDDLLRSRRGEPATR